jgi:secreted Zn-dependent insulinase-like peptidase
MHDSPILLHRYPILLGLLLALFSVANLVHAQPAEAIVKSPHDQRQYEYVVLPNNLRVLLISDAKTDRAAAALEVGIGSSSDPDDRLGLAHFLEHMLFLGTKKYPQAGEYQDFITAHGGNHNAFTGYEETNFHFDIDRRFLEPALDRFSQFFVAPLFTAEYVAREKNAVDSEYQARIKEDERRGYSVIQQLLNPAHPMSRFTVGSLDTLADRDGHPVRDELLRFYHDHYSANLMTLIVLGSEPLPVLKRWVTEKFSAVPNVGAQRRQVSVPPVLEGQLPVHVNIEPAKDERELQVIFPLPEVRSHYRSKPLHFLGNLLGHEGPGSLLSLLKKRGWGDQVSAGTVVDNRTESAFAISIKLSEAGLGHVDDVVGLVFQDIALLRAHGVEAWRYQEQARLGEIGFEFSQNPPPLETVTALAGELQQVAARDVLRADFLMDQYDEPLIRGYLEKLTPDNTIIAVLAHGVTADKHDPWYHTAYQTMHPSPQELASWRNTSIDNALALPDKNPFIPENTGMLTLAADATPVPLRIEHQPGLELWFKQDDTFRLPIADFFFSVRSPVANDSAAHSALTTLYTRLISDQLNEYAYPAQLAGLTYKLYPHVRGFTVRISGYNDKQGLLLEQIVRTLRTPEIDDARFAAQKDVYLRELANVRHEDPYEQTMGEVSKLLVRPAWSEEDRIQAGQPLTAADLRAFIPQLLSKVDVVAMAHGNLDRARATTLATVLQKELVQPAQPVAVPSAKVVRLNDGVRYVRDLAINHPDSSLVAYFQAEDQTAGSHARVELLAQVVSSPFYSDLRTEQQLGYVVSANTLPLLDVPGLVFLVQSPHTPAGALEQHIETFLHDYRATLAAISDTEFKRQKQGVIARILYQDDSLTTRTDRYWKELDLQQYHFDTREQIAEAVKHLGKEDLLNAYDRILLAPDRRRLIVRNLGKNHAPVAAVEAAGSESILEPGAFATGKQFFEIKGSQS